MGILILKINILQYIYFFHFIWTK